MTTDKSFLAMKGNYRSLIAFQKSECIYDITYYFAHHYLVEGKDRTVDQMVQAARSGKQNIAEGSSAATTSRESELKLINVAKASLQELLLDYEDWLRVRDMQPWAMNDPRCVQTRKAVAQHNDSAYYREAIKERSPETIANIAITLIHQADMMLGRLLERLKQDFLEQGGIKGEMTRARIEYRKSNRSTAPK